ncbi:MAG: hypothetical protein ACE367_26080 [Acidimicrobiales bacterium]
MSAPSIEREPAVPAPLTPSASAGGPRPAAGSSALAALAPRSTPAQLRLLMLVLAVVAVLFAVVASVGVDRRDQALSSATDAAAQLIDAQSVQVAIARADALASENYLRGGIEDPATRAAYVAELETAGRGLVDVANRVGPADAQRLGEVSTQLGVYAGLVESARANNRQGFPVGAAYLRNANAAAATMLSSLRDVQASLRDEVNADLDDADRAGVWLHLVGWPLLGVLGAAGWWMNKRFKRLVNVPLAAAGVVALAAVLVGGTIAAAAMGDAEDAAGGPLRSADLAAQARSAGFDAHTQEFFTLITRGNAAAAETAWATAAANAQAAARELCDRSGDCNPLDRFGAYRSGFDDVRRLDAVEGDWDGAVALSLGDNAATFEAFDVASVDATQRNTAIAIDQLSSSNDRLGLVRAGVFVAGLAVAALAVVGVGQRLREYR